jgi:hypothetical protein
MIEPRTVMSRAVTDVASCNPALLLNRWATLSCVRVFLWSVWLRANTVLWADLGDCEECVITHTVAVSVTIFVEKVARSIKPSVNVHSSYMSQPC